jgi:hypothetical protein
MLVRRWLKAITLGGAALLAAPRAFAGEEHESCAPGALCDDLAAEPAEDREVGELLASLAGVEIHERILRLEDWVRAHPHSRFAPVLFEEAAALRALVALRIGAPSSAALPDLAALKSEAEKEPAVAKETAAAAVPLPVEDSPDLGAFLHDGFFLRFGVGLGYLAGGIDTAFGCSGCTTQGEARSASIHGVASTADMLIGGAVLPGLIFAGRGSVMVVPSAGTSFEASGASAAEDVELDSFVLGLVGGYVDIYPDPEGGFHLFASTGFAVSTEQRDATQRMPMNGPVGFYGGGGLGWEGFIGDSWSLGIEARVEGGRLEADQVDETFVAPVVAVDFTCN